MKKTGAHPQDADKRLDPGQFHGLNKQFYEGFDRDYIDHRLSVLCLQHESPDVFENQLSAGASWGKLCFRLVPDDKYQEELKRGAELELVALRQHAAEVLFRLFWVHAHQEPCTWLALARLRRPGDLRDAAAKYLDGRLWADDDDRRRFHARAVWGIGAVEEDGALCEERLVASGDTVCLWIGAAAEAVKSAPLYNAYKHGLAVMATPAYDVTYGEKDEEPGPLRMKGAAGFSYLDLAKDEQNRRWRWDLVRESVDFEAAAGETSVYSFIMKSMLTAGAMDRHVVEWPQELPVLAPEMTPHAVRYPEAKSGIFIQRFSMPLVYFAEPATLDGSRLSTPPE